MTGRENLDDIGGLTHEKLDDIGGLAHENLDDFGGLAREKARRHYYMFPPGFIVRAPRLPGDYTRTCPCITRASPGIPGRPGHTRAFSDLPGHTGVILKRFF